MIHSLRKCLCYDSNSPLEHEVADGKETARYSMLVLTVALSNLFACVALLKAKLSFAPA